MKYGYQLANGKFLQIGNGGFAGVIVYHPMIAALLRGYATASTDDGHKFTDVSWAIGHPEKITDFAYRAVHGTTEVSKAAIRAIWGQGPLFSYFHGCSEGGPEALMEAQRYPAISTASLSERRQISGPINLRDLCGMSRPC